MTQRFSRKIMHICIFISIIIVIIFIAILSMLRYDVKGEINMPFFVSKIAIVSSVDGIDKESNEYKWNMDVIQNNDVYIYIEKNPNYKKEEIIDNIKISNFKIEKPTEIGSLKFYKPTNKNDKTMFENTQENEITEICSEGAINTDTKNFKIANQGGTICFRCANNEIGTFLSNDEDTIKFETLLKKLNINEESIKATISFNIEITLKSNKTFKAENIELKIPNENIVNEGTVGIEKTDLKNIVFKRVEN